MTMLLMTAEGLYAARDRYGRTPLVIGRKKDAFCASFESFAYINLGYTDYKELGAGEVVFITPEGVETVSAPREEMKICSFLWVYYGYPTSSYEGVNVCRILALLMRLVMQMNRESHMQDRLLNIRLPGPGLSCRQTKARGI